MHSGHLNIIKHAAFMRMLVYVTSTRANPRHRSGWTAKRLCLVHNVRELLFWYQVTHLPLKVNVRNTFQQGL